ncbi:MAG: extracellular solute-binding protein [Oscillospiraceae bacterium]
MKKILKTVLLLIFAVCIAAACTEKQKPEPVRIKLMHGWGGSASDHIAMRQIYSDFQKSNPDILLSFDAVPDISILITKATDMLAADKMPDIISTNGYVPLVSYAQKKGLALNLAPYIKDDSLFSASINPSVIKRWTNTDGSIYTIPDVQANAGYWYNEDIFKIAGITDTGTSSGTVVPPRTWEDFWIACDKIAEKTANTDVSAIMMQPDQVRMLLGARLAGKANASRAFMVNGTLKCEKDDLLEAINDVKRASAYYTGTPLTVQDARKMFFDGKSAIYFNGVWANPNLGQTELGQKVKHAAYPSDTGESVAFVAPSSGFLLSSRCTDAQKNACIKFLKYMLSEEVQKRIVTETRQTPSNPLISTNWIKEKSPVLGSALEATNNADIKILSLYDVLTDKSNTEFDICAQELLQGEDVANQLIALFYPDNS